MKIKWVWKALARARSPFIFLSEEGPVVFTELGSIRDVSDKVGYKALELHGDKLEIVEEEKSKPGRQRRKPKVPQNKVMNSYEEK